VEPLRVHARKQAVTLAVETDARGAVRAPPGDLQRVLANLVGNGLKYAAAGGTVSVRTLDADDRVGFEVADTGPGIPADALARVFERGFQAPGARAGHGLGLAIVNRIVAALGGSVRAANRATGGAVVTVWLPRAV
jgi:signal transduction histidine kinase